MIINLHAKVRKTLLSFDKEKKITLLFITLLVDLMREYLPFLTKKKYATSAKKNIFLSLPLGRNAHKKLKVDARHGARKHRKVLLVEEIVYRAF